MADFSTLRKKWTEARDSAKIKKGAVSGVSMGDAIDAVVKAQAKGYNSVYKATEALAATIAKYKSKLPKEGAAAAKWLDTVLSKEIKDYQADLKHDIAQLTWIRDNPFADTVASHFGLNPDTGKLSNINSLLEKNPGMTFKKAADDVGMFNAIRVILPKVGKRASDMSKFTWKAKLAGHDADYVNLKVWADASIDDVKYCAKWAGVDSRDEFFTMLKGWGTKTQTYHAHPQAKKSLGDLLA